MDKQPIKAISVADARLRLKRLKPHLDQLMSLYQDMMKLEHSLANINGDQDITLILDARNKLTLKEDEIIDLQQIFHDSDCVIKDLAIGLIDFVAVRKGKLVWLCYKAGENNIEYYHDWDAGFVGRKPIDFH